MGAGVAISHRGQWCTRSFGVDGCAPTVAADENSARGLDAQNGKPGDPVSGPQVIRGGME